jgi:protein-S-isoprenylcysteine O-methyltransferase Ste14
MIFAHKLETLLVVILFLAYLTLWRIKRQSQIRKVGLDPEVLAQADTPVQAYFAVLLRLLSGFVVLIICLHAMALDAWPPLVRFTGLDTVPVDLFGFALGLLGLGICALAQVTMGHSWRVGIDAKRRSALVTKGIYRWIRNPTYLGLHVMNLGVWFVWPTTMVAGYVLVFILVLEFQVRCEEEHLVKVHGASFKRYVGETWRYLPWVY